MSQIQIMEADVCPGDDAYALDTSTSSTRVEIPAEMRGKFCVFVAEDAAAHVRFGDATVTVDASARSTLDGEALTPDGDEPHISVPAGGEIHRRLQGGWTHLAFVAAEAGAIRFGVAQGGFGAD